MHVSTASTPARERPEGNAHKLLIAVTIQLTHTSQRLQCACCNPSLVPPTEHFRPRRKRLLCK
eukprot:4181741-Pleurochrysis_carterae.AAC.1